MILIPLLNGEPEFTEQVILGDKLYTFTFRWNVRGQYWTFDLLENDVPIVAGIKMTLGGNMTQHLRSAEIPGLGFVLVDRTGAGSHIEFNDLDERILLGLLTAQDAARINTQLLA